ncbi:hypothetical protein J437_LFUL006187 [Ladona fulva]|uniref:Uncharacterized protein n=1 Tax=Ladona fulva TaxID=123851 RepID=A0A8K0K4Q8_LADFU|nr:hypothetical protein J437_LFUL006187 [Ladona fulva]
MKPSSHIELYKNLQEVVFPIFWTEGRAVMTPKLSSLVHRMLMGNTLGFLGIIVFLAIGVVLVLLAAVLHLWEKRRMSSRSLHVAARDNGQVNKPLMGNSSIPHGNVAWTEMRPIVKPNVANGGARY